MAIQIIFPSNIFCVCVIFLFLPAVCIEQSTFVVPISIDGFLLIYYQHAMDVWIFNLCTDELNVKTISEDCYHVRNLFVSVYIKMNGRKKWFLLLWLYWNEMGGMRLKDSTMNFVALKNIFSILFPSFMVLLVNIIAPNSWKFSLFVCFCNKIVINWGSSSLIVLIFHLIFHFNFRHSLQLNWN